MKKLAIFTILVSFSFLVLTAGTYAANKNVPDDPNGAISGTLGGSIITKKSEGPAFAPEGTFGFTGGVDVQLGGTNEPAIVVNPLNPNNIAMASLFSLRVSTDNGATFTAATAATVPATHALCGDSSLAFDSQGRLFWTYLGCLPPTFTNIDIFIAQVNPTTGAILAGYPVNVTASPGVNLPATGGAIHDKEWLAADNHLGGSSPFQNRLHIVWTDFTGGTTVRTTFSTDQGLTWSAPVALSAGGEGFVWPSHNAVAPNGDVYVAYHSTGTGAAGTSGQVFVLRSTDGGVTYPQKNLAFTPGNADITFNVQTSARTLNQSATWTQGSAQPWVLPDPVNQDNVYVIAADDPTNLLHGGANDDMDIFIVRSTDRGVNWSAPARVDSGPVGTTQFFPTAAIDFNSQFLTVTWYDTRNGATNAGGNFLLDVFLRTSTDGGLTFGPEVQINDNAFDPDLGAGARFPGPPPTLRIGEYNGVSVINGISHAVWTGNTATGQQILFDSTVIGGPVDVYFLVDLSGSFGDDLATFQSQAPMVIDNLLSGNLNIKFGLGRFEDYPISPFGNLAAGDVAYARVKDLTFDSNLIKTTIGGLSVRDGADLPQSQLTALFQAATGAGQTVGTYTIPAGQQANFRNGASKLIILWTDAEFHVPTDAGGTYPGNTFADAAAAILALDPPLVIGVSSGLAAIPDLETITTMTGSFAPPGGVDCDGDGSIDLLEGDPLVCMVSEAGTGIEVAVKSTVEAVTLPTANAGEDQTVECGTPITLDGSGSSDPEDDPLVFTWTGPFAEGSGTVTGVSPTVTLPLGTHEIMLIVFDGRHGSDSDTVTITAEDTTPPVITCPANITVECTTTGGIPASDPQLAPFFNGVIVTDMCDDEPSISNDAPDFFAPGATPVTFTSTDDAGNGSKCMATVTVVDSTPPDIAMSLDRDTLWPANHKLVDIHAMVTVSDICDPNPTFILVPITSSEPDDAKGNGDGRTVNDIQADVGTPDLDFLLRAERAGSGPGRVYTVPYQVMDASGNTASASATVMVPHSMRRW